MEDGSLNINKYRGYTGDYAIYEGNFYSDKAPGMTFMALPAIAAAKLYLASTNKNYRWIKNDDITLSFIFATQIATIFTSGLLTAIAATALFFVAIKLGAGLGGATFGALAYGLATPAWGWATAFFGHASAASCLFLGFVAIIYLLDTRESGIKEMALGFIAGALLSWAVVIEYTSAPASAVIAIYGLVNAWKWERGRFLTVLASAALGALIFILPLLAYNYSIYGNPFSSGYNKVYSFPGMREGFYGIKVPDPSVASQLLIGIHKGILWLSPLLLFVPYALFRQWKVRSQKGIVVTITVITLYYLAWNSGYTYWTGGSATGPRFLTPILPFLCLPLAILWPKTNKYIKSVLLFFFLLSFFICLASVSVTMTLGVEHNANFVVDYLIPEFVEPGKYRISVIVKMLAPFLKGKSYFDLLPLFMIFLFAGLYIFKRKRYFEKQYSDPIK